MSYSCLEELQVDLDLHTLDKISVLSKAGCMYDDGWLIVTDDGICHLFDKDGNLDDIQKVKHLKEKHIRKDLTKIIIPNSVTKIEELAFYHCCSLTSIRIPNSVMSIEPEAFYYCISLMNVTIPDSVTSIRSQTFNSCIRLTNMIIPNSVESIGNWAFYYCNSLTNIIVPNSVMSIGDGAFYNCDRLTNLIFKSKTLEQVKKMKYYPWGIVDKSIIRVE